jgi:hypothetical protein
MSFIALLNDVRKCLVSVHLARADFWFVIPMIPPEPFESFMMVLSVPISLQIPLKLTDALSHEYFYMHACYQRSTGLFAVCCQRRRALVLANSRDDVTIDNILVKYICYCMCLCKAWCQLYAVVGSKISKCFMLLYLFMNYVLSEKSHVEFFLAHMLSLGVTLHLPSFEMAKS